MPNAAKTIRKLIPAGIFLQSFYGLKVMRFSIFSIPEITEELFWDDLKMK
jgi:hypothetical protein